MPIETSDGAGNATSQPRLAAAEKETSALASHRPNGLYNESQTVTIPQTEPPLAHILSFERYGWHATILVLTVVFNIGAHLFATGWLSGIARDSDLQSFKIKAADQAAVINDKVDRVNEKVDRFVDTNRRDHEIIASDLKEVAKATARIEGYVSPRTSQPVATAIPAAPPPSPAQAEPSKEKIKSSVKRPKPAPVQAPAFSWFR